MNRIFTYHMMRYFLLVLLFLPLRMEAQSLEDLLKLVSKQNLQLAALDQEYQAALNRGPQTRMLPATSLSLGGFVLPIQTAFGPQRMRMGIMQSFPWFGTLDARENLSLAGANPLQAQRNFMELQIQYQLKIAYFELYEHQEIHKILARNIDLLQSLKSLSLRKVEGGKGSTSDVLRLDIKLRELNQQINVHRKQEDIVRVQLNQLLHRDPNTSIQVVQSLDFVSLPLLGDSLNPTDLSKHPAVKHINSKQVISEHAIAVNQKLAKPSFAIGVDYMLLDDIPTADFAENGRDAIMLHAKLNIPLQQKAYQAKTREENLKIEALELRKDALLLEFQSQLLQSKTAHEEAKISYGFYGEQIESTLSVIQLLRAEYSNDGKKFDELIDLEMDLLSYEIQQLKSIVSSHKIRAEWERILF